MSSYKVVETVEVLVKHGGGVIAPDGNVQEFGDGYNVDVRGIVLHSPFQEIEHRFLNVFIQESKGYIGVFQVRDAIFVSEVKHYTVKKFAIIEAKLRRQISFYDCFNQCDVII